MLRHSPLGKQKSPSRHSFTSRVPRDRAAGLPDPPPRPKSRLQRSNPVPQATPRWPVSKFHLQSLSPAPTSPPGFTQEAKSHSQAVQPFPRPAHLRRARADQVVPGSLERRCSGRSLQC